MTNPEYFIENQNKNQTTIHNTLTPYKSARFIINHVENGIKIAKKEQITKTNNQLHKDTSWN